MPHLGGELDVSALPLVACALWQSLLVTTCVVDGFIGGWAALACALLCFGVSLHRHEFFIESQSAVLKHLYPKLVTPTSGDLARLIQ